MKKPKNSSDPSFEKPSSLDSANQLSVDIPTVVDPRFNPEDGSANGLIINHSTSLISHVTFQLELVTAPSLKDMVPPSWKKLSILTWSLLMKTYFITLTKIPLESTHLDVEFLSSPVTPAIVIANPSIPRGEVLEDLEVPAIITLTKIPLESTPLDVEFPSSHVTPAIVIANPSIPIGEVPEDLFLYRLHP